MASRSRTRAARNGPGGHRHSPAARDPEEQHDARERTVPRDLETRSLLAPLDRVGARRNRHGREGELGGVRLDGIAVDLDGAVPPVSPEDEEPGRIGSPGIEEQSLRALFPDPQRPRTRASAPALSRFDDDLLRGQPRQRAQSVDGARGLAPARDQTNVGQGIGILVPGAECVAAEAAEARDRLLIVEADREAQRQRREERSRVRLGAAIPRAGAGSRSARGRRRPRRCSTRSPASRASA